MYRKIYIEITNTCNLNCPFCSIDKNKTQSMELNEVKRVISEVKKYTKSIYLHVLGEPLIHKDLQEILEYAKGEKVSVNITTNGFMIEEKKDILLGNNSIKKINISLHSLIGIPKNKWDSYLVNVLNFVKEVSKLEGKILVFLRLWINDSEFNDFILNKICEYLDITIIGNKVLDYVFISYGEEFTWPSLDNPFISNIGSCLGTKDQLAILVNGDVVPCCLDSKGIIIFGNIFKESFSSILSNKRLINMKNGFNCNQVIEQLCQRCSYRGRFNKLN